MAVALRDGRAVPQAEIIAERPNGTRIWCQANPQPILDQTGKVIGGMNMLVDISARKRAELAEAENARRNTLLSETAARLLRSQDAEDAVKQMCDQVLEFLDCHVLLSYLVDGQSGILRLNASAGISEDGLQEFEQVEFGEALCGCVAKDRRPVIAEDIAASDDSRMANLKMLGLDAYCGHPLIAQDRLLGTLAFGTRSRDRFTSDEIELMRAVTNLVAIAMQRIRTEQALRESEERFRALTNATSDVVFRMNADWTEMRQLQGRQFIADTHEPSRTWMDRYIPADDQPSVHQVIEQAIHSRGVFELEHRVIRRDRSIGWTHSRAIPLLDDCGEIVEWFGAASDITLRKEAEEAQRRSEERHRQLLSLMPSAVYSCDASGIITYFNERAAQLWGQTPRIGDTDQRFCGSDRLTLPDGTALPHDECPMAIALREGRSFRDEEVNIHRPDGSIAPVMVNIDPIRGEDGEIIGAINAFHDISAIKQAEEALAHQRRLYEGVLSTTPDLAYIFDRNHRFIYANEGLLKMWGRTWDEAIGKNCLELGYEPWHAEMHDREIEQVIATKEPIRGVVPFTGTFGRRLYDYIFTPVLDARGEVQAVAGTTRDVTEIKQVEEALRESEEQLAAELAGMTRLHELSLNLAHQETLDQVMQEVMSAAAELLGSDRCTAQLTSAREGNGETLRLVSCTGFDEEFSNRFQFVRSDGFTTCAAALERKEPVIVEDLAATDEFSEFASLTLPMGIRSAMSIPLLSSDGASLGLLTTYWNRPHRPNEHQLRLLDLYAQQAASQVERRAAEQTLREHARTLETLIRVGATVSAELDTEKLIQAVTDAGTELSGAKFGAFFFNAVNDAGESYLLYTLSGAPREAFERFGVPRNTPLFSPTFAGEEVIRSADITQDPRYGKLGPHYGMPSGHLPVRSYLAVPVISRSGSVLGGLFFGHPEAGVFTEQAERLISGIGAQAAIALDNSQLYQAARESEERFRMLADNMAQLAWTCAELGNVTWYNKQWFDYTGLTLEASTGRGWEKVQHPDHSQRVLERVQISAETGEPWEDVFPMRGKDGEYRWFLSRAYPIRNDQGEIIRWFGTSTDITEQRAAEEALREADRRKDEFLATLAHELRNPLAPIRSGLEVMELAKNDPEMTEEIRSTMLRQTEQLVRLIDDLLDVSRITRGKLELQRREVELNEVVKSAVEATQPFIEERGHQLTVTVPGGTLMIEADPHRLAQVLSNLLHNAAKYSPDPGPISLTAQKDGQDILLTVKDRGMGIPADKLREVFEMFAQIGRSSQHGYTGLGIGLTLAKSLIEMHGGTIDVQSNGLGQGTEFIVRLPGCVKQPEAECPSKNSKNDGPLLPKQRVLIVDDNQDAARMLSLTVTLLGNDVRVAHDGIEAIDVATEFQPDVILLDLGMPRMDGYEAATRLRNTSAGKNALLVALTGWGQDEDKRKTMEAGFDHHLVKPADPAALKAILAQRRR